MKTTLYIFTIFVPLIFINACAPRETHPETVNSELLPTRTPQPIATATERPSPTATIPAEPSGLIAFFMKYGNMGGIFVMNADGSGEPVLLSAHPTSDSKPGWSPDGSQIVFESLRDDIADQKYMDIYIMNSDGSHLTRLTDTDGWYAQPDWSPDGSRLAIATDREEKGNTDLYILDLDTRELTRVTDDPGVDRNPSWSPDGSHLAFFSNRSGNWDVFSIDVETGETMQLTDDTGDDFHPDWSPDGRKILFSSSRDEDVEIYIMDTDGENQKRLTNSPGNDTDPEWSPDGNYFAFVHDTSGVGEIYVMDLMGSPPALLFENTKKIALGIPAWSIAADIGNKPVFGPPFCLRDTNGDLIPDSATNTFPVTDLVPYISFPYRNIKPDNSWSIFWDYEGSDFDSMNMGIAWKEGSSGWYTAMAAGMNLASIGPRKVTVKISIDDEVLQEIECEIVASEQTSIDPEKKDVWVVAYTYDVGTWEEGEHRYHFDTKWNTGSEITPEKILSVTSDAKYYDGYVLLRPGKQLARDGEDCVEINVVRKDQETRFHVGYPTDREMTYEEAVAFFETLNAKIYWDDGESAELVQGEIIPYAEENWTDNICSYTDKK